MQLKKEQLQRQQVIMTHLGYYRHKCDGIWGPASIEAKKSWEQDASFIPGLPTNGLPLGDRDILPQGMRFSKTERMFTYQGLTDEKIAEILPSNKGRGETEAVVHQDTSAFQQSEDVAPQQNASSENETDPQSDDQDTSSDQSDSSGPIQQDNSPQAHFQSKKKKKHHNR